MEQPPEMRAFMLASERVALEEETGRRQEWLTVSALSFQAAQGAAHSRRR